MTWKNARECGENLSYWVVQALINEVELAPKPGLVDPNDRGSHQDMNFELMVQSARSLQETFKLIAEVSYRQEPSQQLREEIAGIGRAGEKKMMQVTGGINTHKGAIWVLGLLTSAAAVNPPGEDTKRLVQTASRIARFPDHYAPSIPTHGSTLHEKLGVKGARGEAEAGYPNLIEIALPALDHSRRKGISERQVKLDTLVALIACLEDTCIIHRGGLLVLELVQEKAAHILQCGGVSTLEGWRELEELNQLFLKYHVSPGGSADLLAAALFLDQLKKVPFNESKGKVTI
ncbi:triphosphoribosyl-dephospho-CoA synthase [Halobacillus sp. Marseille-P3879]|uniref:triphosphoribosyl-dephospho-CoA synthase n=1 Tax=Halobacillus sp. Marseille-P3879 TaxID=2045014 RepID=UPI000C7B7DFC|nr:triphosphoribosyl-dephospho-CoA synthase [Halobacillus sp. Marseille-P3879]